MARRGDYRSFYDLIKLLIVITVGLITVTWQFLSKVHRYNKWADLGKSLVTVFIYAGIVAGVITVSATAGVVLIPVGIIYFCWWWYKKFTDADIRVNSAYWQQQAWWWTLDGWQFEHEVARVFRLNGFKATVTKGSGDGGVDIILKKDNYKAIVQCKHHQYPLSPEAVRALWGIKDDWGADEVIMVASSGLTSASVDFVRNKPNYKVLNLNDIIRMSQCEEQQEPKTVQNTYTPKKQVPTGRKVDF